MRGLRKVLSIAAVLVLAGLLTGCDFGSSAPRYQLVSGNQGKMHLLETNTGRLWVWQPIGEFGFFIEITPPELNETWLDKLPHLFSARKLPMPPPPPPLPPREDDPYKDIQMHPVKKDPSKMTDEELRRELGIENPPPKTWEEYKERQKKNK